MSSICWRYRNVLEGFRVLRFEDCEVSVLDLKRAILSQQKMDAFHGITKLDFELCLFNARTFDGLFFFYFFFSFFSSGLFALFALFCLVSSSAAYKMLFFVYVFFCVQNTVIQTN